MFLKIKYIFLIMIVIVTIMISTGCGGSEAKNDIVGTVDSPSQTPDTNYMFIPRIGGDDNESLVQNQEDAKSDTDLKEEEPELSPEDDGLMEIYSEGDHISLSDDVILGQVTLEDIIQGDPILYDRYRTDGFVFEWILSDDEDSLFEVDGVLIISEEDNTENTQVIQVKVAYGMPVSLENKFEYMDVNFDNVPDLLICAGQFGNQGFIAYCCFLQTEAGFVEEPTFSKIVNPSVDTENKQILSQWRNWAASHSWAEYKYENNAYVLSRELCEEAVRPENGQDASEDIWVWTVNGEEIGRSDNLSESEKENLFYNENSEWRLMDDRWRTIYNNGLMRDFSIYGEP